MAYSIRPATPEDVPAIFELILALADYEHLKDQVTGNPELLHQHLFGPQPLASSIIAEVEPGPEAKVIGYTLFFTTYSSFLTRPGLYLEDLFVLPQFRKQGLGKALIQAVAQQAVAQGCGRLEWSVLDWNEPSIGFYRYIGADVLPDWRICRMTGSALQEFGAF
jgi:GNAT superfamily N-acetyltransferase